AESRVYIECCSVFISCALCLQEPRSCLVFFFQRSADHRDLHSFPTRRSSDLTGDSRQLGEDPTRHAQPAHDDLSPVFPPEAGFRSEEHTSELQSRENLVCRLLLEKKKDNHDTSKNAEVTCDTTNHESEQEHCS